MLTNLNYIYIWILSYYKYHLSYPGNVYDVVSLYLFGRPSRNPKKRNTFVLPGPSWLGELLDLVDSKSQIFLGALGTFKKKVEPKINGDVERGGDDDDDDDADDGGGDDDADGDGDGGDEKQEADSDII